MTRNPFRDREMRRIYDVMTGAYDRKAGLWYPSGDRCCSSAVATWFWRGYDGIRAGQWERTDKQLGIYAAWRAGRDARAREDAKASPKGEDDES